MLSGLLRSFLTNWEKTFGGDLENRTTLDKQAVQAMNEPKLQGAIRDILLPTHKGDLKKSNLGTGQGYSPDLLADLLSGKGLNESDLRKDLSAAILSHNKNMGEEAIKIFGTINTSRAAAGLKQLDPASIPGRPKGSAAVFPVHPGATGSPPRWGSGKGLIAYEDAKVAQQEEAKRANFMKNINTAVMTEGFSVANFETAISEMQSMQSSEDLEQHLHNILTQNKGLKVFQVNSIKNLQSVLSSARETMEQDHQRDMRELMASVEKFKYFQSPAALWGKQMQEAINVFDASRGKDFNKDKIQESFEAGAVGKDVGILAKWGQASKAAEVAKRSDLTTNLEKKQLESEAKRFTISVGANMESTKGKPIDMGPNAWRGFYEAPSKDPYMNTTKTTSLFGGTVVKNELDEGKYRAAVSRAEDEAKQAAKDAQYTPFSFNLDTLDKPVELKTFEEAEKWNKENSGFLSSQITKAKQAIEVQQEGLAKRNVSDADIYYRTGEAAGLKKLDEEVAYLEKVMQKLNQSLERNTPRDKGFGTEFMTNMSRGLGIGFAEVQNQAEEIYTKLGVQLPHALRDGLTDAMMLAIEGADELGDKLKEIGTGFLKIIQRAFLESAASRVVGAFGFNSGGKVVGGSGVKDDVPAVLTGGEYVINRRSAQMYGYDFLEKLNRGEAQGFARGGAVNMNITAGRASEREEYTDENKKYGDVIKYKTIKKGRAIDRRMSGFAIDNDPLIAQMFKDQESQFGEDLRTKEMLSDREKAKQQAKKNRKHMLLQLAASAAIAWGAKKATDWAKKTKTYK